MLERKIHSRSFYEIARWQLVVFFTILGLLSIPIIKIVTGLFIKDPTIHSVIYIILSICSAVILFCVGCFKDETLIEYVPSKKYFVKKEGEDYEVICEKFGVLYRAKNILQISLKYSYKTPEEASLAYEEAYKKWESEKDDGTNFVYRGKIK